MTLVMNFKNSIKSMMNWNTLLLLFAFFASGSFGYGQTALPVNRTVWNSTPTGWTDSPLGSYTTTFACSGSNGAKFDSSGNSKVVYFSGVPSDLSFVVKSNATTTSSLLVEQSVDGVAYTTVVALSGTGDLPTTCTTKGPYTLNATTQYVRWTFTKGNQNMTMDDVSITTIGGVPVVSAGSPTGSISTAFTYNIVATNSPTSYALASGTLPAGLSLNTTTGAITGTPTATGTSSVTVAATNGLGTSTAATISFTINTAPAPEINIRGIVGTNPTISDGDTTPQGTDNTLFAATVIGNSQTKNFRIENTGSSNLLVSGLAINGANPTDFSYSGISFPLTITAGNSKIFSVTFGPNAAGIRTATVEISSNDGDEALYDFAIQGNGIAVAPVEINVKGFGNSIPDNSLYPSGLNATAFGVATVGVSTVTRVFTIQSLGSNPLLLTGTPRVVITGTHAAMFTVTVQPSAASILPGSSLNFSVTFDPTSPGIKSANVVIANNDSDEDPYNFAISGNAKGTNNIYVYGNGNDVIKGSTTTTTTNLTDFGPVAITTGVKQRTFVISNFSGANAYFGPVTISGPDAAMFSVASSPSGNAVITGNSTAFTINFTPTTPGTKNATVTFRTYTNVGMTTPISVDPIFTFAISGDGENYTACAKGAVQIIAQQDFENVPAAPVWDYNYLSDGNVNVAGGTYNNGSGVRNAFIGGSSFQFTGIGTAIRTTIVNLDPIDSSQFSDINLSMRVGAFRTGTTQGVDVTDFVQVESSIDGGVNWSVESVLRGYNNSRWDFAATGVFDAYYSGNNSGTTVDTRDGNADLADGYSTYNVKGLPTSNNLLLRLHIEVDRGDEVWVLDNIKIEGRKPQITTWTSTGWTASAPTSTVKAIIDFPYNTAINGNISACECEVKAGRTLTVGSNGFIDIQSDIINDGIINVLDDGSIVQSNNGAVNTGKITMNRTVNMKRYDYIYWSSPVDDFAVSNVFPTTASGFIYQWLPTISGNFGVWSNVSENMQLGKGYIIRAPTTVPTTLQLFATSFFGKARNGIIRPSIERGNFTNAIPYDNGNGVLVTNLDDNWNLVGNPYPSAINSLAFLNANPNIEGAVRLWTHGALPDTLPPDPFYGNFLYNYDSSDYIVYNGTMTLTGPSGFSGNIAAGQAFFVLMDDGIADNTQTVIFNNQMRSSTYANNQFYRPTSNNSDVKIDAIEKSRIWLDLIGINEKVSRTGIGYIDGATLGKDRMFDAFGKLDSSQNFYSLIGDQIMAIQGRPLPLDTTDRVPLGMHVNAAGNYKIAVFAADGYFADSATPIYLEDRTLGIVHDLRQAPYNFTSETGTFDTRFILRYNNESLGSAQFNATAGQVVVAVKNHQISIKSFAEPIVQVTLYDLIGQQVALKQSVNANELILNDLTIGHQPLIVKILLKTGQTVTRKILF